MDKRMSTLPSCKILEQKSIYFIVYQGKKYIRPDEKAQKKNS